MRSSHRYVDTEARHGYQAFSFGVGKSRPSARLCSVYYTAVFRIYLGHRRDHLSSSGRKELSGLGMCCYVARLERCDIVMLQPAPP